MDKDLISGNVSDVLKYDVALKSSKLLVSAEVDLNKGLDLAAEAIPGSLDDLIIKLVKAVLAA